MFDQGSEFYNNLFKKFLKINNSEMYWTYNEEISVVAEKFIRTLKTRFLSTWQVFQKMFIWCVRWYNKYNNAVHRTIKMKPIDVTSDSYAEYNEDSNKKDLKFKVGDHVRISKYKNIFTNGYTPNWSEEIFVVSKIKDTVPWTYVISDLNGEPIAGSFYEKELQKASQEKLRIEKLLKEKVINCTSNGKGMVFILIVGLKKKALYKNESILS